MKNKDISRLRIGNTSGLADEWEPIFLDTSWLIEFGFLFDIQKGIWNHKKHNFKVQVKQPNLPLGHFIKGEFIELRYVHELQNLFEDKTGSRLLSTRFRV